ncbi:glycosyltransferase [Gemmata sp. JC717]|uniref:glycosyltransferase family 2 protein n=1 Tax=Gemmata algarum TaxID=2975278 RepID=UPI0021BA968C|nr:glycosyltransferase [Gemmata algarum]MDY3552149.1 glycosyltransferase [Gemmata algarum]
MRISAIIPTRGRFDSLCRTLDSVRKQRFPGGIQLVVVDDASDPPLPPLPADVRLVQLATQSGACAARNAGVRVAEGEFLLFMDDDAELLNPDDITTAIAWFEERPKLGAVGFRQLTPDRQVHYMQPAAGDVPVVTGVFFSYTCIVRRSVYEKVGGFNEAFGYYFEEVELSLKLHAAGYDIIYDPDLAVIHYQDDRHRDWTRIHRLSTRNALMGYLLHYPAWMLLALFIKRLYQFARITGRTVPGRSDLWWLVRELAVRRSYLRANRHPFRRGTIREFHNRCRNALSVARALPREER